MEFGKDQSFGSLQEGSLEELLQLVEVNKVYMDLGVVIQWFMVMIVINLEQLHQK